MSKITAKQLSFHLILIAMPFIILLLIELALRLSDFGHEVPLFIEVENTSKTSSTVYLQPNPKVITRYFADERLAPKVSPDTVFFNKHKNDNSFRIFIQGGSTAAGFPYGRWASLQGMLEQRFKRLYPNQEIEIINTAMAAVNSYTLLDFVDEIIEQKPDLVLIYAGHNEYLGIMGVGSAFAAKGGRLTILLHLKFKNWRIYQLIQKLYYALLATDEQHINTDKTLMSQVVKEKEIVFGSDLFTQGIVQFKENMSLILHKYQAAGIPVVFSNLVSNESGQVPFSSVGKVDWQAYKLALTKKNRISLEQEVKQLNNKLTQKKNAADYYKLALNLQRLTRYTEAKQAFVLSKDYDLLRFRAPSQFNEIIKDLAVQYQGLFIDTQASFSSLSNHGIIGNALILEHLHPTIDGYFLLAESFVDIINEKQLIGVPALNYPKTKARLDIPVSKVDKLYGDFVIKKLLDDYPFKDKKFTKAQAHENIVVALPTSHGFEKQALIKRINKGNWLQLQKELLVKYQQENNISEAAKIAGVISTAMVDNHKASYIAGQLYQQLNDWQLASYYHKKALANNALSDKEQLQYLLVLAQDYFLVKNYVDSLALLQKANKLVPTSSPTKRKVLQYISRAKQAMALKEAPQEK